MDVAGICIESDMDVKTTVAVCEYHGAPTTQLYAPQDYFTNRRDVVKFSNISGTSTTDTVQR